MALRESRALLGVEHNAGVQNSRAALLDAIGDDPELTLVRGFGNIGDQLIRAGTHRLLEGHVFREIAVDELPSSGGDTVLLPGSGAFSRRYHEWMPRALALAELRFDRVIVLPSSFDVGEDSVRRALERTGATVFAREPESLRRIEGLCRARLAHDCAFFFDFSGFGMSGRGTLHAFRTDGEATDGELTVEDNNDISVTASSLEEWLAEIERHAVVRTDRAHVMIAAALMGKEVEYAPNSYHKLDALAAGPLRGFPVSRIDPPRRPAALGSPVSPLASATRERLRAGALPPPSANGAMARAARVTAVILTRDRVGLVEGAVRSVTAATVPTRVLVIDNNSGPSRAALADDPRVEVRWANRNLGCAGGRRLGAELVDTEYVLFLDDDAELIDGALEHMLADLDSHPEAAAVTSVVVGPQGDVQHFGGWMTVSGETVQFEHGGAGLRFDDPSLPATGPSGWAPGTAALVRARVLAEVPIDDGMAAYYEDNDWCYRVEQRHPGSFRRCREALVLHHHDVTVSRVPPSRFVQRYEQAERLAALAHFHRANGLLLDVDLVAMVPELRRPDGSTDVAAARLLMELIAARGVDWTVAEWMNGGFGPLLDGPELARLHGENGALSAHIGQLSSLVAELGGARAALEGRVAALEEERSEHLATLSWLHDRNETLARVEAGGWWRLRSRLLPVLRAASRLRAPVAGERG